MAGIKRKSAAAAQPDVKSKSKKVRTEKRSGDKDVKSTKSSKKAKRDVESDDLIESDTSEDENGFTGFSASKDADEDVSMDDEDEDDFVGGELEAALGKDNKKKDHKSSKGSESKEDKSGLAALNCRRYHHNWRDFADS